MDTNGDYAERNGIRNSDVMIVAVWKAGGGERFIDVEDAYATCWEMVPDWFKWRTKALVDRAKMTQALANLSYRSTHPLVRQGSYEVKLSTAGLLWIAEHNHVITYLASLSHLKAIAVEHLESLQLAEAIHKGGDNG